MTMQVRPKRALEVRFSIVAVVEIGEPDPDRVHQLTDTVFSGASLALARLADATDWVGHYSIGLRKEAEGDDDQA